MRFTPKTVEPGTPEGNLREALEPVARGMGLSLVELTVSRHKGSTQIRAVVYKKGIVGIDDCSAFHRASIPRLELAFPGADLYVEVSSPGIDRLIKDGAEFVHYVGRGVRCYRTDISGWSAGILESADEAGIVLKGKAAGSMDGEEKIRIPYDHIAKAKLDPQWDALGNQV
ncbi:ribosome maturation factor RimP [Spirochaetia bacterium]|nr:ribosome maturation factor RimP [Spirochaetia bacterium]